MGRTNRFGPFVSLWAVSAFSSKPQNRHFYPPVSPKTHHPAPGNTSGPIFTKTPENNDFGAFFRDQAL
jgi:hypothetical protein